MLPFVVGYVAVLVYALGISGDWNFLYLLPVLGFVNAITHLSTYWSAHCKAAVTLARANGPEDADFVCCSPDSEQSTAKVPQNVPIYTRSVPSGFWFVTEALRATGG